MVGLISKPKIAEYSVFLQLLIAAIGLGLSAAGAFEQFTGAKKAEKGAERAENARQAAQNLDAQRRKRQIIRDAQLARSQALANATAQGAQEGSGLQGGLAQISGEKNDSILGVNLNQQLGNEVFAANKQQRQGQSQANVGQAIQSVGGAIMQNRGAIERVGTYAFG